MRIMKHSERRYTHKHTHTPADVGDVGTRVAFNLLCNEVQVHIWSHLHLPEIDLKKLYASYSYRHTEQNQMLE